MTELTTGNIFSKIIGYMSLAFSIPSFKSLELVNDNKGVFGVNLGLVLYLLIL
jgi:hypothetical protein